MSQNESNEASQVPVPKVTVERSVVFDKLADDAAANGAKTAKIALGLHAAAVDNREALRALVNKISMAPHSGVETARLRQEFAESAAGQSALLESLVSVLREQARDAEQDRRVGRATLLAALLAGVAGASGVTWQATESVGWTLAAGVALLVLPAAALVRSPGK